MKRLRRVSKIFSYVVVAPKVALFWLALYVIMIKHMLIVPAVPLSDDPIY